MSYFDIKKFDVIDKQIEKNLISSWCLLTLGWSKDH